MVTIPKKFRLGGRTWTVQEIPGLKEAGDDCYGLCDNAEAVISLREGMSEELEHHTFYHELVHAMCFTLGWRRLNKNEDDVDALGNLLYQYLASKKGSI